MPIQYNKDGSGQIVIQEFGGIDYLHNAHSLNDNFSPSARNVWFENNSLESRLPFRGYWPWHLSGTAEGRLLPGGTTNILQYSGSIVSNGLGQVFSGVLGLKYMPTGDYAEVLYGIKTIYVSSSAASDSSAAAAYAPVLLGKTEVDTTESTAFPNISYRNIAFLATTTAARTLVISGLSISASAAQTFPSPQITSKMGYILCTPITSTGVSVTSTNTQAMYGIPITLTTSAIATFAISTAVKSTENGLTTSTGLTAIGPVFYYNLNPGGPIYPNAVKIVKFIDKYYAPFLNLPTYLSGDVTAGDLGGAIEFTGITSSGSDFSTAKSHVFEGAITTAWPSTYGEPIVHKNYVFVISSANRSRVRWSNLVTANADLDFPVNNYEVVDKDTNSPCLRILVYNGILVIISRRGMWAMPGETFDPSSPGYSKYRIETPPEFLVDYPEAITIHTDSRTQQNILKILTRAGLFTYAGGTKVIRMPEDDLVRLELMGAEKVGDTGYYNKPIRTETIYGYTGYGSMASYDGKLLVNIPKASIPSSTNTLSPVITYVQDVMGRWTKWFSRHRTTDSYVPSSFEVIDGKLFSGNPICSSANPGFIKMLELVTTTEDSTGFEATGSNGDSQVTTTAGGWSNTGASADWESKRFNVGPSHFGTLYIDSFSRVDANVSPSSMEGIAVGWSIDGSTYTTAISTPVGGGDGHFNGGISRSHVEINQSGKSIQIKVGNQTSFDSTGAKPIVDWFRIYKILLEFRLTGDNLIV